MIPGKVLMFIKALVATACLAVVTLCGVFIARLLGFDSDQPAGWGDMLTLISILSAGLIASLGLFNAHNQAKKERERIALAQAKIIFETLAPIHLTSTASFAWSMASESGTTFANFFEGDPKDKKYLSENYQGFIDLCDALIPNVPEPPNFLRDLPVLYHHSNKLGDAFMGTCLLIAEIRKGLRKYVKISKEEHTKNYQASPEIEKTIFFNLIANLAKAPIEIENLRQMIPDAIPTTFHHHDIVKGLYKSLEMFQAIDFTNANQMVDDKKLFEMFRLTEQYFRGQAQGHSATVVQKLIE